MTALRRMAGRGASSLAGPALALWLALYGLCNPGLAAARVPACALAVQAVRPVPPVRPDERRVATQNLWRLFDDRAEDGAPAVAPERYRRRLDKLARQLQEVLRAPDVVAVQEAENQRVLDDLAARLRVRGGPAYRAVLQEGHDRGGIDVGYLVRADWTVLAAGQVLAQERLGRAFLFDRPPLWLRLRTPQGATLELLNVHLKSLRGSEEGGREARRVARKRRRQAEVLGAWLQAYLARAPQAPLLVLGDFNATPAALGGVDVLGALQAAGLVNALERLPPGERYTYVHGCRGEALDRILVAPALAGRVRGLAVSRGNAGASGRAAAHTDSALGSADHDGLVLSLALP